MSIEDLTSYVEHDIAENRLTVTATEVTATSLYRDEPCWLSKDFGQDYFNAVNLTFAVSFPYPGNEPGTSSLVRLSRSDTPFNSSQDTNDINVSISRDIMEIRAFLYRGHFIETASNNYGAIPQPTAYFTLTRARDSNVVTLKMYSDEARTNLLTTWTLTGVAPSARWRYLIAYCTHESTGHVNPVSSTHKFFDLHEAPTQPEESSGPRIIYAGPYRSSPASARMCSGRVTMDDDRLLAIARDAWRAGEERKRSETAIISPLPTSEGVFGMIPMPWDYYQRFYEGDSYCLHARQPSWRTRPVENICLPLVENNTTILTDGEMATAVTPVEPEDLPLADLCERALRIWRHESRFKLVTSDVVKDSRKFGVGFYYCWHDAETSSEQVMALHPRWVVVDPWVTHSSWAARGPDYVFIEQRLTEAELRRTYGLDHEIELDPDFRLSEESFEDFSTDPTRRFFVVQFYYRSDLSFEEEFCGGSGEPPPSRTVYRRAVLAGGKVILDEENPYEGRVRFRRPHRRLPIVPVVAYRESERFWSMGDIENVFSLQVYINRVAQLELEGAVRNAGGIYFVNKNLGLTEEHVSNAPMKVIAVSDPFRAANIVRPPSPSRYLAALRDDLKRASDDQGGQHDISRGAMPPGERTGREVAIAYESDRTRMRSAGRALTDSAAMVFEHVVGSWAVFGSMRYHLELDEVDDEGRPVSVEFTSADLIKDGSSIVDLDIMVGEASSLPHGEQVDDVDMKEMLSRGVITPEEYLAAKARSAPWAMRILAARKRREQLEGAGGREEDDLLAQAMAAGLTPNEARALSLGPTPDEGMGMENELQEGGSPVGSAL